MSAITVHVFGRTDVGRTREHNEDAFVVADLTRDNATLQPEVRTHDLGPRGTLFMVADGMGGAAAGEVASAMAIETVIEEMRTRWAQSSSTDPEAFAAAIRDAGSAANARIHKYASEHPEHRGMGSTATIAGLLGDRLYVAQVGDSRAYLVRNGVASQITKDQSLVQKLVEAGELTAEEAELSERRNIILQALGPEPRVKVDLTSQQIRRGDTLVLCSDGLSGQVKADAIASTVVAEPELMTCCKALIDLANNAGGPDNITVIVARFEGEGLADVEDRDAVGHQTFRFSGSSRDTVTIDPDAATPPLGMPAIEPPRTTKRITPLTAPPLPAEPSVAPPATKRNAGPLYALIATAGVLLAAVYAFLYRK
jgi:protein phosphatase